MTNIAKLLKDAPKGMKLYSPLFGEVRLVCVNCDNNILVETEMHDNHYFAYNGVFRMHGCYPNSKCLLFPSKDCPTWEGWTPPVELKVGDWVVGNGGVFKITQYEDEHGYDLTDTTGCVVHFVSPDYVKSNFHLWTIQDARIGDILTTSDKSIFIYAGLTGVLAQSYFALLADGYLNTTKCNWEEKTSVAPATKEQQFTLFHKMHEAGYEWDDEKKELKNIPKHYDISSFHAGMPVLVRADNVCRWNYSVFSHITGNKDWLFAVCNGVSFTQCIPFEGNETLLGTNDMCNERFVNW